MFQSGHDSRTKEYNYIPFNRRITPARPVINGEARYENIPNGLDNNVSRGWLDDTDVRVSAYWSMLAGAAGYTYGCNDIWQMYSPGKNPTLRARTGWAEAIHLPGSTQMMYMKQLLTAFPWHQMVNDQSVILNENPMDSGYIVCSRGLYNDLLLAYTPVGKSIKLNLTTLETHDISAFWFNPRSGSTEKIGNFTNETNPVFEPFSIGRGSDFVLIITTRDSPFIPPHLFVNQSVISE
jgi:hypothetical protein